MKEKGKGRFSLYNNYLTTSIEVFFSSKISHLERIAFV